MYPAGLVKLGDGAVVYLRWNAPQGHPSARRRVVRFRNAAFQHDIETAVGNQAVVWVQAQDAYLADRRQGGYAQYGGRKLVDDV